MTTGLPPEYILVHTDGACSGNPGPGAYAAVISRFKDGALISEQVVKGSDSDTTNNRMEMTAVIAAFQHIGPAPGCPVILRSDSQLITKGLTEWLSGWIKKDWWGANGPVKNSDLWKDIVKLKKKLKLTVEWIKGHNGHAGNERADSLAKAELKRLMLRKRKT